MPKRRLPTFALAALALGQMPAMALDCAQLADPARKLVATASQGLAGEQMDELRGTIERGEETVTRFFNARRNLEIIAYTQGVIPRKYVSGTPPKTIIYELSAVSGPIDNMEPGATADYVQTTLPESGPPLVEQVHQLTGARGTKLISGCPLDFVSIHRQFTQVGGPSRRSIDFDFAPLIGVSVFSSVFRLLGGKPLVQVTEITSLDVE